MIEAFPQGDAVSMPRDVGARRGVDVRAAGAAKVRGRGADVRAGWGADVRAGWGADVRAGWGADVRAQANLRRKDRHQDCTVGTPAIGGGDGAPKRTPDHDRPQP